MAKTEQNIDPKSGFNPTTKTYHSLRPKVNLPPLSTPLSITDYALSLLKSSGVNLDTTIALIDSDTGNRISFTELGLYVENLANYLQYKIGLSKGDSVYVISSPSLKIPILYFALLSIGVIISPANPLSSKGEICRQIDLTKPVIVFATKNTAEKTPSLKYQTILLDSPEFQSVLISGSHGIEKKMKRKVEVKQTDTAAILYSSGTTGKVKGVVLTHRNFIGLICGYNEIRYQTKEMESEMIQPVGLFTVPLFHVFGFFMFIKGAAMAETVILMEKFDFIEMLKAVEKYKVTYIPVSPPLVIAMAKLDVVKKFDLSSLQVVGCGGAPLGKDVSEKFTARFPNVLIVQGYGLTESAGSATRMIGPDESTHYGSAGLLAENLEAKIVDPVSGEALSPGQQGELWLRGPIIMSGYVGDNEATASTLDSEGWLKTGDLCYFDTEGFLFVVDRLKELIKYKAYQVPPAELEHLLQSHPEIADAAVIPYPDENAGQIPMAYIVRQPGSNLSEGQVKDFIAKQVAPYKKIRKVAFVSAIPKSPAGKILRRELVNLSLTSARL
ncbi:hypothetical protein MKX01_002876 [Papaver californicum]|nr:hypothetical protein MKX01_002876 [Papaver californicum]